MLRKCVLGFAELMTFENWYETVNKHKGQLGLPIPNISPQFNCRAVCHVPKHQPPSVCSPYLFTCGLNFFYLEVQK